MTSRDDALTLIAELRTAGRITTVEARALVAGVNGSGQVPAHDEIYKADLQCGISDSALSSPGQIIASARKARGLSQKYIADQLGISVQAISQWENNKSNVNPSRVGALGNMLGVRAALLLPSGYREAAVGPT